MSYNYQPPQPPYQAGQGSNQPSDYGFFDSIRSWRIRREMDRWFGGVASGLAMLVNMDPIIVRGLIVVLLLINPRAIMLGYAVLWALVPERIDNRIHLEQFMRGNFDIAHLGIGLLSAFGLFGFITIEHETGWYGLKWTLSTMVVILLVVFVVLAFSKARANRRMNSQHRGYYPPGSHGFAPHAGQHGPSMNEAPEQAHPDFKDAFGNMPQAASGFTASVDPSVQDMHAPGAGSYGSQAGDEQAQPIPSQPAPTPGAPNQPAPDRAASSQPAPGYHRQNAYGQYPPASSFAYTTNQLPPHLQHYATPPAPRNAGGPGLATFLSLTGIVLLTTAFAWLLWSGGMIKHSALIFTAPVGVAFLITGVVLAVRAARGKPGTWLTILSVVATALLPIFFMLFAGAAGHYMY
ncbi:MAG: PspC domain-containing protein [Actinomycetaceae bacterium]|nr:PspC domain-containing protein [Actinomycetaceae bacterium]